MNSYNEITFYQLENLILQKVPFKFIDFTFIKQLPNSESSDTTVSKSEILDAFKHLNPYYLRFFKEQFVEINSLNIIEEINMLKLSFELPFILLCDDGQYSKKIAAELEKVGYKNIYVLANGLQQLLIDANN